MNAYELADKLQNIYQQDLKANCWDDAISESATMLRQQADRIAELEKVSSKPVAWWTGKFDDECEDFMFPDTRQSHIDHPQSETHNFFPIPLYTHPHKELSDEEIKVIATQNREDLTVPAYLSYARAIIKASRGEE